MFLLDHDLYVNFVNSGNIFYKDCSSFSVIGCYGNCDAVSC